MDVVEIRKRNLQQLIASLEARGITKRMDQAQALGGLGSSFLSQLLGGKKMGDDVARKIDDAMGYPRGWMDRVHSSTTAAEPEVDASQAVRDYRQTLAAVMRLVHYIRDRALEPITDAKELALGEAALEVVLSVGPARIIDGTEIDEAARRVAASMRTR